MIRLNTPPKYFPILTYKMTINIEIITRDGSQFDKKRKEIQNSSDFQNFVSQIQVPIIINVRQILPNERETVRTTYVLNGFTFKDRDGDKKKLLKIVNFKMLSPKQILKYANIFIRKNIINPTSFFVQI